jgi:hypothetical protein
MDRLDAFAEVARDEPVEMDLADALVDVYAELRTGLAALEEGRCLEAEFKIVTSFEIHWGVHAWQALAAIHGYRTGFWRSRRP